MRPRPNSAIIPPPAIPQMKRLILLPLHAAHPCVAVPIVHRSHLLAEALGWYWCQTGMAVLACAHGVERDQGTALRMQKSVMGFSCCASQFWLCWKNRALLFLSPCLLSSCLGVCFGPVCLCLSTFCHFPSTSDFLLPLCPSPSFNNVLSSMATGPLLALSSLSLGEC